MQLNKSVVDRLSPAMNATWNYIGYDLVNSIAECGERMTNAHAIEGCIDANRLASCGNDSEADKLVSELIKEHGYKKVFNFLKRNFKFY